MYKIGDSNSKEWFSVLKCLPEQNKMLLVIYEIIGTGAYTGMKTYRRMANAEFNPGSGWNILLPKYMEADRIVVLWRYLTEQEANTLEVI